MAEYQILWTRQEEPDPDDPSFVHILEVGVADSLGDYLGPWPVSDVIAHIKKGDHFIVAAVVWAPVQVVQQGSREYIRAFANGRPITNLQERHQHGAAA